MSHQSNHLLFTPQSLVDQSITYNFITQLDVKTLGIRKIMEIAESVAEDWSSTWPEGNGFGSSDFTYALQDFLHGIGKQTGFVDGKLTVINSLINKITEN